MTPFFMAIGFLGCWILASMINIAIEQHNFQKSLLPGTYFKYLTKGSKWAFGTVLRVHGHLVRVQVGKESLWLKRGKLCPLKQYDLRPENFEQQ